jgi:hypothetical protein
VVVLAVQPDLAVSEDNALAASEAAVGPQLSERFGRLDGHGRSLSRGTEIGASGLALSCAERPLLEGLHTLGRPRPTRSGHRAGLRIVLWEGRKLREWSAPARVRCSKLEINDWETPRSCQLSLIWSVTAVALTARTRRPQPGLLQAAVRAGAFAKSYGSFGIP